MKKNYFSLSILLRLRRFSRKNLNILRDFLEPLQSGKPHKRWTLFNATYFKPQPGNPEKFILCDVFMVPEWLFVNVYAFNQLSAIYNCKTASFSDLPRRRVIDEIYNSVGITDHLQVRLTSRIQKMRHKELFIKVRDNIKSKEDLFNLTIGDVHIGIDIYESILRTGLPTVEIDTLVAWQNIFIGLEYYVYFDDLCSKGKVEAMVLSHDNYIYMGIPSKVGFKYNIPSYLFNSVELLRLTRPYELHDRFKAFPEYFNLLNESEKTLARSWSKEQLKKRLKGEVGVEMSYQQKSAFTFERVDSQILNNGKKNIVVATHEFYDNPHGYGGMLFLDFYEWLIFLGELSNITNYNWYLKPHRDVAVSEITQLKKICGTYHNFILLAPDYTFHQLKEEGVDVALTCYGTVGHELPLLGFIVINCGNNPHMAYNFNVNPENLQNYREILLNLETLSLNIDEDEIYEFFYVYKKIIYTLDFSVQRFLKDSKGFSSNIYEDFLKVEPSFRMELQTELEKFINSKETYSFLLNHPQEIKK